MNVRAMMLTIASVGTLLGASGKAVAGDPSYYFGGTIKAATTGDVSLTFYQSDTNGNDSLSVNGSGILTDARTLASGMTYDLGTFTKGQALTFTLDNTTLGDSFTSTSKNFRTVVDTVSNSFYTYKTPYFGFEDEPLGEADKDYNDVAFGLSNVTFTPSVPEPATWALMVLGVGLVGAALRGKRLGSGDHSGRGARILGLPHMTGAAPQMA